LIEPVLAVLVVGPARGCGVCSEPIEASEGRCALGAALAAVERASAVSGDRTCRAAIAESGGCVSHATLARSTNGGRPARLDVDAVVSLTLRIAGVGCVCSWPSEMDRPLASSWVRVLPGFALDALWETDDDEVDFVSVPSAAVRISSTGGADIVGDGDADTTGCGALGAGRKEACAEIALSDEDATPAGEKVSSNVTSIEPKVKLQ
jgi:hypothetical protein